MWAPPDQWRQGKIARNRPTGVSGRTQTVGSHLTRGGEVLFALFALDGRRTPPCVLFPFFWCVPVRWVRRALSPFASFSVPFLLRLCFFWAFSRRISPAGCLVGPGGTAPAGRTCLSGHLGLPSPNPTRGGPAFAPGLADSRANSKRRAHARNVSSPCGPPCRGKRNTIGNEIVWCAPPRPPFPRFYLPPWRAQPVSRRAEAHVRKMASRLDWNKG